MEFEKFYLIMLKDGPAEDPESEEAQKRLEILITPEYLRRSVWDIARGGSSDIW